MEIEMNNDRVESFITFCDDFIIAEESKTTEIIGRNIKKGFYEIEGDISKCSTFIKNLSLNVGLFKSAKLPKQMSDDLEILLQNLCPRRDYINQSFSKLVVAAKLYTAVKGSNETLRDTQNEIMTSVQDVEATIEDTKKSKEYKRLYSKDYDFSNNIEIPMMSIVTKAKKLNMQLIGYKQKLKKAEAELGTPQSTLEAGITNQLIRLYKKLIENAYMQCRLLRFYFKVAKASIEGTLKNKEEKKNGGYTKVNRDYVGNFKKKGEHTSYKKKKITEDEMEKFKQIDETIKSCNNKIEMYPKYKDALKELCDMIGIPTNKNIILLYDAPSKHDGFINYSVINDNNKSMKILDTNVLYHTSTNPNLKELDPHYVFQDGDYVRRCWSTPRVYFAIGSPITRDRVMNDNISLYTPVSKFTECYIDNEMGGSAVYVTVDKPIKVQKLNFDTKTRKIEIPKLDE